MTNLKRLREEARMTQQELAVAAGLSQTHVGYLERGQRRDPGVSTVRALARALAPRLGRSTADVLAELMGEEVEHAGAH